MIDSSGGVERANAYAVVTLISPKEGWDLGVRLIVNNHPLSSHLIDVKENSQRTVAAAFLASWLLPDSSPRNVIGLHSSGELPFFVETVICHFRQRA